MIFTNKDQVLFYMNKGLIKMSNQDASFFQTIYSLVLRNKNITSNQDQLFNKLLVKHKTQLKRKGYVASQLCELPWNKITVIASQEKYTKANVRLVDGILHLRTPYNKKFVSELNGTRANPFIWNTGARNYQAPFSTRALKIAVNVTKKHFNDINYCSKITEILEQVPSIESKFWRPTLVKGNTGFYIAGSNNILAEKIQDIEFNQDPLTFFKLSKLGVSIDPNLIGEDKFAKFAALYHNEVHMNSAALFNAEKYVSQPLEQVIEWLSKLNISKVVLGREPGYLSNRKASWAVKKILTAKDIRWVNHTDHDFNDEAVMISFVDYNKVFTQNIVKKIIIREHNNKI